MQEVYTIIVSIIKNFIEKRTLIFGLVIVAFQWIISVVAKYSKSGRWRSQRIIVCLFTNPSALFQNSISNSFSYDMFEAFMVILRNV